MEPEDIVSPDASIISAHARAMIVSSKRFVTCVGMESTYQTKVTTAGLLAVFPVPAEHIQQARASPPRPIVPPAPPRHNLYRDLLYNPIVNRAVPAPSTAKTTQPA